eukprot:gene10482-11612_t
MKEEQLNEVLVHASNCTQLNCNNPACHHMKVLLRHLEMCSVQDCVICLDMNILVRNHAVGCQIENCSIRNCSAYRILFSQRSRQAHEKLRTLVHGTEEASFKEGSPGNISYQQQRSWYQNDESSISAVSPPATSTSTLCVSVRQQGHPHRMAVAPPKSAFTNCQPVGYDSDSTMESPREREPIELPRRGHQARTISIDESPISLPTKNVDMSARVEESPKKRGRYMKTSSRTFSVEAKRSFRGSTVSRESVGMADTPRTLQFPLSLSSPQRTLDFEEFDRQSSRMSAVPVSGAIYESDGSTSCWGTPSARNSSSQEMNGEEEMEQPIQLPPVVALEVGLQMLFSCRTPSPDPMKPPLTMPPPPSKPSVSRIRSHAGPSFSPQSLASAFPDFASHSSRSSSLSEATMFARVHGGNGTVDDEDAILSRMYLESNHEHLSRFCSSVEEAANLAFARQHVMDSLSVSLFDGEDSDYDGKDDEDDEGSLFESLTNQPH